MKYVFKVEVEMTPEEAHRYADEYCLPDAKPATIRADLKASLPGLLNDTVLSEYSEVTVK